MIYFFFFKLISIKNYIIAVFVSVNFNVTNEGKLYTPVAVYIKSPKYSKATNNK